MIREDCLYYEKCKDMGATVDWCCNYPHLNFDCEKCERYIEKNFVRVVRCRDCKWYYVFNGHGSCDLLDLEARYIQPDWFCADGERKEDDEIQHP